MSFDLSKFGKYTKASVCLGCLPTYYLARNKRRQGRTAGWSVATAAPLGSLPAREAGRGSEVVPWRGLRNEGGQWAGQEIKYKHETKVMAANKNAKGWVDDIFMTWAHGIFMSTPYKPLLIRLFFFNARSIRDAAGLGCLCQVPQVSIHFLQSNKR